MDWQKNVTLYILSGILVFLGSIVGVSTFGVMSSVLAVVLLTYYLWEDTLKECKIVKYLGFPLTVFGFFVSLWGLLVVEFKLLGSILSQAAGLLLPSLQTSILTIGQNVLFGGFYIELIGLVLYSIGFFIAYFMKSK